MEKTPKRRNVEGAMTRSARRIGEASGPNLRDKEQVGGPVTLGMHVRWLLTGHYTVGFAALVYFASILAWRASGKCCYDWSISRGCPRRRNIVSHVDCARIIESVVAAVRSLWVAGQADHQASPYRGHVFMDMEERRNTFLSRSACQPCQ